MKAKPIIIKTGNTFKGPGWDQKVTPNTKSTMPKKIYDPKKSGSVGVF